ncbi:MAG: phosphatase PAP2 family protein [Bacillota bacterium]
MNVYPVKRPFFSNDSKKEALALYVWLAVAFLAAAFLILAWPFTRSVEFVASLQVFQTGFLEYIIRAITFLGDDEFFMVFFSVLIWCVNKSLGFWTAFILLSSATYSNLVKDITLLERPPVEGVTHPEGSYAFPSGHTLTAITVWGYMAVRLRSKGFWIWAIAVIVLVAFSRMVLGYHYFGDILGGFAFGIPFLLAFLWISAMLYEKGLLEKFSMPLLLVLSLAVPLFLVIVLPGVDPPKIIGYLSGASFGYVLEKEKIKTTVKASLGKQFLKIIIGVLVLFVIIVGLSGVLPSAVTFFGFIRYFLGGLWVTLIAPIVFRRIGLSGQK